MKLIEEFYNELPLSVNEMYYNQRGRGRGLTDVGQAWENRFIRWLAKEAIKSGLTSMDPSAMYEVRLLIILPEIFNAGWPKKAKSLFKKIDVDNRIKMVLDGISKTFGVDDSCNFIVSVMKYMGDTTGVWVSLRQLPDVGKEYFLDRFMERTLTEIDYLPGTRKIVF